MLQRCRKKTGVDLHRIRWGRAVVQGAGGSRNKKEIFSTFGKQNRIEE